MSFPTRPLVIIANWKMHKTIHEAENFIQELIPLISQTSAKVYLGVPFTAIQAAAKLAKGSKVYVGAQNMSDARDGAFTGEIAAQMILEAGGSFVILGHSERRKYFNESNQLINAKLKRALAEQLLPVLCIGETAEQHKAGKTHEVLREQIRQCLDGINSKQLRTIYLAYEPIWAIGTGLNATPEHAQTVHRFCRDLLAQLWDKESADLVILLYGGSVNTSNAAALTKEQDIDGLLIGGASLSAQTFSQIINDQNVSS